MATFELISGRRRVVTLTAGDPTAEVTIKANSNVNIELTGGGSVAHTITGTSTLVRTATTSDESYHSKVRKNTFTYTPGTSVVITIDDET